MKTKIGLTLCALAVSAGWAILRADDEADAPKATGRVLVLANEKTLEGNIEREGDQYRVRRTVGEVWIGGSEVLRLCQTYPEAYEFLRARANLRDPDEHFRLASWCQAHGLKTQALEEARNAVEMRPGHAPSQRLLYNLQHARESNTAERSTRTGDDANAVAALPPVNSESLSVFVTRVQPILMNACASCHANGRGGAFKLARTYGGDFTSRKSTLQNLSAVLARVNSDQLQASPFLMKAASIHGAMPQPALKSRDNLAYRTLEDWVKMTVDSGPQLGVRQIAVSTQGAAVEVVARRELPPNKNATGSKDSVPERTEFAQPKAKGAPPQLETKEESTDPVDSFDPLIFNRQMHPPQKQDGGK